MDPSVGDFDSCTLPRFFGLVTVTGGGGFLGEHLVRRLLAAGATVRVLDMADPPTWVAMAGLEYVRGDVRDRPTVDRALRGATAVVHAAFAPPHANVATIRAVNYDGTANVWDSANRFGVGALVAISSTIVERRVRRHPVLRSAPINRLYEYADSRASAERLLADAAKTGTAVAIVRPKTFVGPGRVGGFGLVFRLVRDGAAVPLLGPGTNHYQLLDIRDFADGVVQLVAARTAGLFQFGASSFGTVAEDLQGLIDHAGTGAHLRRVSSRMARVGLRGIELAGLTPLAEWHECAASGRDSVVDTSAARSALGWEPEWSNATSMAAAYDWFITDDTARTTHPIPWAHRALRRTASAVLR